MRKDSRGQTTNDCKHRMIGSTDDLDRTYLRDLKRLATRIEPAWISDHLCIVDDARVADHCLKIHQDAYRLHLIEALSAAYPNLLKLLGEALFEQMAHTHIQAHPSQYRNPRWYGGELAEHLVSTLPRHPIASELTWHWTERRISVQSIHNP